MKDFNFKQKKSKWLIMAKDFSVIFYVFPVASILYFLEYVISYIFRCGGEQDSYLDWLMKHWYFGIVGWGIAAAFILYGLYKILHGILYLIYMYINYVSFRAYLPLTMEDLETNHVKNQADFIRLLVIYRIKKVKILSESYNTEYEFDYSEKDKETFRELYSRLQPSGRDGMSDEFRLFYDEYLEKYDIRIPYNDIHLFFIIIGNKKLCN